MDLQSRSDRLGVGLTVPLASDTAWKRFTFQQLLVDSVVEPETLGMRPPQAAPVLILPAGEAGAVVDLATWCAPCSDQMPSIEMLNRRLRQDGLNIKIVTASVDDAWGEVIRCFGAVPPTFTVLWDKEKRSSNAYGTRKFPETYLIDPAGRVAAKFVGPRDWYNQGTVKYFDDVIAGRRKPTS